MVVDVDNVGVDCLCDGENGRGGEGGRRGGKWGGWGGGGGGEERAGAGAEGTVRC